MAIITSDAVKGLPGLVCVKLSILPNIILEESVKPNQLEDVRSYGSAVHVDQDHVILTALVGSLKGLANLDCALVCLPLRNIPDFGYVLSADNSLLGKSRFGRTDSCYVRIRTDSVHEKNLSDRVAADISENANLSQPCFRKSPRNRAEQVIKYPSDANISSPGALMFELLEQKTFSRPSSARRIGLQFSLAFSAFRS